MMTDSAESAGSGSGILLLHKESGIPSTRALTQAKRYLQIKKAGHGGTLDPLASGLLVLLFGEATRYAAYLLGGDKQYLATIQFGSTSDTDDAAGTLTPQAAPPPHLSARIAELLPQFRGEILQTAPAYSALKHRGKPLYAYARRAVPVPAKTRRVHIHHLALHDADATRVRLVIRCGGGTYVRALARDLGAQLGCGAHLAALQRTHCGKFALRDAVTLHALADHPPAHCRRHLHPIEAALGEVPAITLPPAQVRQLATGLRVPQRRCTHASTVRILSGGKFAGLAQHRDGQLRPLRLLHWTRPQ